MEWNENLIILIIDNEDGDYYDDDDDDEDDDDDDDDDDGKEKQFLAGYQMALAAEWANRVTTTHCNDDDNEDNDDKDDDDCGEKYDETMMMVGSWSKFERVFHPWLPLMQIMMIEFT